ncbi:hypothetical protein PFISCL1PPCAC_17997, partial [Pristionchus fissidentatus]
RREEGEGERREERRDRSKYPVLPLLESTPLKARGTAGRAREDAGGSPRRRHLFADRETQPADVQVVSIGVGTSARDLPQQRSTTGVQCDTVEDPHSRHGISTEETSSSFGQVPERLRGEAGAEVRVVEAPTPRPRQTAPASFRVHDRTLSTSPSDSVPLPRLSISSPDSMMRELLEGVTLTEAPAGAAVAPVPTPRQRTRMYAAASSEEEEVEEAENTLENLESIREH